MKIRCIANTGKSLSQRTIESGQLVTTQYSIEIGKTYLVYSIGNWKGSLDYLIDDSNNAHPGWYPAELFEVVDHHISSEWYFAFRGYDQAYPLYTICGYKEMVFDTEKHNNNLLDWEPGACAIFRQRKNEIDLYEELKTILIDKKGSIITGVNKGWEIFIKDNSNEFGGYTVILSKKDETFVEDWVKDKEELRRLFNTKEWKIAWQE